MTVVVLDAVDHGENVAEAIMPKSTPSNTKLIVNPWRYNSQYPFLLLMNMQSRLQS